ncbi:MAG: trypsin-like peptidase domain-containing protein [Nitrospira sp.]|nr:trypsin-like peptidase domain-containing protein [Nitrospira sp.]MCA9476458.1 trypsin-like peptidase domain-containing protein [Nitrospira sp.]MCB9709586.1 trypsin-like peptidase domain-containing protein [Nitrospiraceae bacterium]MDR4489052.1 serine protease [Nitrospirales bacterium]
MAGWIDRWRDATVAIGQTQQAEIRYANGRVVHKKLFIVVGTGVIFGLQNDPSEPPCLVTAKHVFRDSHNHWAPSRLQLRFSWFDETRVNQYFGIGITLKRGDTQYWIAHPNAQVDLACLPLSLSKRQTGRSTLPRVRFGDFGTTQEIYEGASLMLLGYADPVGPDLLAKALVRQGIVSWVSPTKPESTLFWIDGHIFPGNSGGPVFKVPAGIDRDGHFATRGDMSFVGIVTQTRIHQIPLTAGGREIGLTFERKKIPETILSQNYTGIGLAEPAVRVQELLSTVTKRKKR